MHLREQFTGRIVGLGTCLDVVPNFDHNELNLTIVEKLFHTVLVLTPQKTNQQVTQKTWL